jgi:hypothetical protein
MQSQKKRWEANGNPQYPLCLPEKSIFVNQQLVLKDVHDGFIQNPY